ncbi:MAG TPA: TatD family hydrolase [Candidatus Didemnitutus sp.]|nr:TatD family hydrolase [Candidatus Didemnitutus sp.]
MSLTDTHTHLESFARRGDLPAILKRAWEAGVEAMITIGTDADDWALYRDLAAQHRSGPAVHYTVGLHPCSVDERWAERFALLEGFWNGAAVRPVALGEIGLDRFHLPKDDAAAGDRIIGWQKAAFADGLVLAKKLDCPVVVHSRGAFRECVDMIDASGVAWSKVVFHCFTEGPDEMAELTKRGGFGSFTGIITYKTADAVRAAAKAQGLERLMIETDAPYLTPMPHRGKPNEPAYVRHTADFCAGLFDVSRDELASRTTATAKRFFGI